MKVVGFTGMPGSGKSEAMAVARARSLPVIRMGDLIWAEVANRGLPKTSEHVGPIATEMRERHGAGIWAQRTVDLIRESHATEAVVLVDGVRSLEEVEVFRDLLGGDFVLVGIHTDRTERFARMTRRAREDDPETDEGHDKRDSREMSWGIARTIALADEMVVNDDTLETFRERIGALLDELS